MLKRILQKAINTIISYRQILFWICIAAFVLPEISVYFHKPARGADIHGYILAGEHALNVAPLYEQSAPGKNNTWPPFFSFFATPLAISKQAFGLPMTKILWYLVNFFCLIRTVQLWNLMLYGKKPSFFSSCGFSFTSREVFVPLLLVLPAFVNNFFYLQINVLLLLLITESIYQNRVNNNQLAAGLFLGLAASIKAFPGLFIIYFAVQQKWKVALYAILFGTCFSLVPILFYGLGGFFDLMRQWLDISFGQPLIVGYDRFNNQSLYAFWERTLAHQLHLAAPGSLSVKMISQLSGLSLIFGTLFFFRRSSSPQSLRFLMEGAALCVPMMIFSPIAWRHYWVLLYPAAAVMNYVVITNGDNLNSKSTRFLMHGWWILLWVSYLTGKKTGNLLLAYSSYTWAALLLFAFLLKQYHSEKNRLLSEKSVAKNHSSKRLEQVSGI